MSNSEQPSNLLAASPDNSAEEPVEASLLRSLMMAMRHQQTLEMQEVLVDSHRSQEPVRQTPSQQQQQREPAAAASTDEADIVDAKPPSCKPGGYPEEIFIHLSESDKDELGCRICFNILRDCYECRNRHRFCYACVYEWSSQSGQGSNLCPVCRCPGEYARNGQVSERLGRRRVRCADGGPPGRCNWRGCLSDLESHKHRQYELHEIYTSSELPSLRPERTGDTVASNQRMTTTELVRRHSEAKAKNVTATATNAEDAGGSGGARLLGRRQQDAGRRLPSAQQQQQQQQPQQQQQQQQQQPQQQQQQQQPQQQKQEAAEQQPQQLQYKRLVRPRPPPPSAAQRLQESREQLALLMTLLTIQMQERQQAIQQVQLETRRREIERRRQLAEVENLNRRLAQVSADVGRPQQPQPQPQRQQGQQQQQQQQQATPRLPAIGGSRRSSQQGGTGGGAGGTSGGAGNRTGRT